MTTGNRFAKYLRIWFALTSSKRGLTASELLHRMPDLSQSSLYRHLEHLSADATGVYKTGDRWRVAPGAVAPIWLADEEVLALAVALEVLPGTLRTTLTDLARKLDATLSPPKLAYLTHLRGQRRAVVPGIAKSGPAPGISEAVQYALAHEQILRLTYQAPDGTESLRDVEARGVLVHQGVEHLVAWCRLRKEVRQFSLLRVRIAAILDETFVPDPAFDLEAFIARAFSVRAEAAIAVVVDLAPDVAYLARERTWHASQRTEALGDGWTRLRFEAGGLFEIAAWIAGLGGKGRVRGPPELVERVRGLHKDGLTSLELAFPQSGNSPVYISNTNDGGPP